ncbi:MAG: hypothetical protein DHS20C21_00900 [Gemmatimonadota bacterium]|nr:MAG: hypothetical protein DHS20C21_00900 [Gemmatimonadota bacterium]
MPPARWSSWLTVIVGLVAAAPSVSLAQVSGTVVDQATLQPLADAIVTLQTTTTSTVTAPDGTFSLPGANGANLVIVGAKKGLYNASAVVSTPATGVQIALETVPQEADTSYSFVDPNACGGCHHEQADQWTGSPMSRAGQNTWVYDIYNGTGTPGGLGGFVYTRDSQHASANPESECAACHQPESWIMDPFSALEDIGNLSGLAMHGVSCEVCHKIAHIDEEKKNFPGIYPGAVTFTRPSAASGQVMYGVLGDTDFILNPFMRPSYQPQLVAEVCAACHQDKNDPDGDGDFEEPNGVISEPTYNEWAATPYADPQSLLYATCADCHMPSYGATQACNVGSTLRDPETIRHHRIEGTTAAYLENAVTMTVFGNRVGGTLEAQVSITNDQTGHHVPTGVTIRNMILLVEAWRQEDGLPLVSIGSQVVHDLGGVGDPAQGYYAGLPGKYFSKVNHDSSGQGPTFFTDATGIQFDNRIPALATDVSNYSFEIPPGGGTLRVRARLIYRRSFRFLADAKGWTEDGHGNPLEDVMPPYYGHLMEEDEWSAVVTGVDDFAGPLPLTTLHQNRPNPGTTHTTIGFHLERRGNARVAIFDLQGRLVTILTDGLRGPGEHALEWHGLDDRGVPAAAGVYVYRLDVAGETTQSRRMVWLR